jgi:hypothetical protein
MLGSYAYAGSHPEISTLIFEETFPDEYRVGTGWQQRRPKGSW